MGKDIRIEFGKNGRKGTYGRDRDDRDRYPSYRDRDSRYGRDDRCKI